MRRFGGSPSLGVLAMLALGWAVIRTRVWPQAATIATIGTIVRVDR